MKFKEFKNWCNDRACDGCWGSKEAIWCIETIHEVNKVSIFKREKIWKEKYEEEIVKTIVEPLDKKREELLGGNE